jgi:hypothetical protein
MDAKNSLFIAAAMLATLTSTALGGNGNDGQSFIVPPQANYGGKTHAEWVQSYNYWMVNVPGTSLQDCPLFNDGSSFEFNQQGPVFFLGATAIWSDPIPQGTSPADALASYEPEQRSVTVPAGKALYVEVDGSQNFQNGLYGHTVDEWEASNVRKAKSFEPFDFFLEIDGQNVSIDTSLDSPFFVSTILLSVPVAPDSAFQYLLGSPAAFNAWAGGDAIPYLYLAGMSFLIKPLPPGDHTIKVRTFDAYYGYEYSELAAVDWHITVTP